MSGSGFGEGREEEVDVAAGWNLLIKIAFGNLRRGGKKKGGRMGIDELASAPFFNIDN